MYNYNLLNESWQSDYKNSMSSNMNSTLNSNMNNSMNSTLNRHVAMPSVVAPNVGYDRGNLFENLYDQYKNYKPDTLSARTDQERLFLELSRVAFAAHELNLYLDLNPDDMGMLRLFNDYRQKSNELMMEYESKYGPLSISSNANEKSPFMWEKSPWPWEEFGNV